MREFKIIYVTGYSCLVSVKDVEVNSATGRIQLLSSDGKCVAIIPENALVVDMDKVTEIV